ncbi:MAG TPA: LuxR C-terminal-related transcriptional regulator, partial [Ktedonobacterales bacterium]|nr:LuxR C-terminal-related transcriptional regulator [Ktedonobacterales bacterium]
SLADIVGGHRHIVEYFVNEVINTQPTETQKFLLQTGMLPRLTGALCDAVTGQRDGARQLEAVEQAGLFLTPLDEARTWYRYHALFAEALQSEARRRLGADYVQACSRRASEWYQRQGWITEAIEAALTAGDDRRAANLMDLLIERQLPAQSFEMQTLERWLARLPETVILAIPNLCLAASFTLTFGAKPPASASHERIELLLASAEHIWCERGNLAHLGMAFALHALALGRRDNSRLYFERAATYARQALEWLPEDNVIWRSMAIAVLGAIALMGGQLNAAYPLFREGVALSELGGNRHATLPMWLALGYVSEGQGLLYKADELYHRIVASADDSLDDRGRALLGLARIAYEWNDLASAEQNAQEAGEIGSHLGDDMMEAEAALLLARVRFASGSRDQALSDLEALLTRFRGHSGAIARRMILCWKAHLALALGDFAIVQRWEASRREDDDSLTPIEREREEMLLGRWLIAQGKTTQALDLLSDLLTTAQQEGRAQSMYEAQVLLALAYSASHQELLARQTLLDLVAQTNPEGYQRLFLDEGGALFAVLRATLSTVHEKNLSHALRALSQAFLHERKANAPGLPADGGLSPQERRVLRLLAAGRTNSEIAGELVVSANTVKTQLKSIYRKLAVTSRLEARDVAGLLSL